MKLLKSTYPSASFDTSYEEYANFLKFTDKHDHEVNSLEALLPGWLSRTNTLSVLDVGAGSGRLATVLQRVLSNLSGSSYSLTLLEPAQQAANALRVAFAGDRRVEVDARSLQQYVETPRFRSHDLVLASHVNYYFKDRTAFFEALLDLVRPGGTLCCISGAISLLEHPFYRDLGPQIWRTPGVERSFGLDGYGACAEELELIAFEHGYVFASTRSPASLNCGPEAILLAVQALRSVESCRLDPICRCFGFLLRVPVDAIYRARQHVLAFIASNQLDQAGLRIDCEDKVMLLRRAPLA